MLGKLFDSFSGRRLATHKENVDTEIHARQLLHPSDLSIPFLSPSRLRVVVFRDETGVKLPIFDSQQVNTEKGGEEACTRSLCDMRCGEQLEASLSSSLGGATCTSASSRSAGWATNSGTNGRKRGFVMKRRSTDSELLGEMMFGSMPMKVVGNTVKVHYIRSTDQLMLSKVFTANPKPPAQCSITDFTDSYPLPNFSNGGGGRVTQRSFSADPRAPQNNNNRRVSPDATRPPLPTASTTTLGMPISHSSSSLHPSPSPLSSSPSSPHSSYNLPSLSSSLTRRIQRSRSTSLENPLELYRKLLQPLDQHTSSNGHGKRRKKYAISFIICLSELSKSDIRHFQSFLFSHFTLIDAHLERLKIGVEEACEGRRTAQGATEGVARAYEVFLQDFLSLYRAPRIESPVWLSLVSCIEQRRLVCVQFMEVLASAIVEMETKDTKFFLSSLLTSVLSHHLAWVFTVTRQHSSDSNSRHGKPQSSRSLGLLAESHPYNPLWAQLGDLCGAVSNPLKISRTVITGQAVSLVSRLLYLLTYFIRCSEVEPGLTPEPTPLSPPLVAHAASVKIPSTIPYGEDTMGHDLVNENDVFCSRASSVTVMSDQDRVSFSPFASPVSYGMDSMPIVRTHPFGIRAVPHSLVNAGEMQKGSQSESDLCDSFHFQNGVGVDSPCTGAGSTGTLQQLGLTSVRNTKKPSSSLSRSGDLSTSHLSAHSSKRHSPFVSSASSSLPKVMVAHVDSCDQPPSSLSSSSFECSGDNDDSMHRFIETIATCPVVSTCSLRRNLVNIATDRKPLLSPEHFAPRSLTSNSSLDSGYDRSLSFTDSARDSCQELAGNYSYGSVMCSLRSGGCSNKNGMLCSNKNGMVCPNKNVGVVSSGSGSGQVAGCESDGDGQHALLPNLSPRQQQEEVTKGTRNRMSAEQDHHLGSKLGQNAAGILVDSLRNNLSSDGIVSSVFSATDSPSAQNSSKSPEDDEVPSPLFSPLSPDTANRTLDLDGGTLKMAGNFSISQDPLKPLPPRRLKNHIRAMSGESGGMKASADSDDVVKSSAIVDVTATGSQSSLVQQQLPPQGGDDGAIRVECWNNSPLFFSVPATRQAAHRSTMATPTSTTSLPLFKAAPSEARPDTSCKHKSLPLFHIERNCVPLSFPYNHSAALSSPPNHLSLNRPLAHPSSVANLESPCDSEVDSGRGTKTSLKTEELESSLISELSYDPDSDCTPILSSLHLGCFDESGRSSSSPPVIGQFKDEREEEMCSSGRGESQSFPLPSSLASKAEHHLDNVPRNNAITISSSATTSNRLYGNCNSIGQSHKDVSCCLKSDPSERSLNIRRNPSLLHQQLHDHDNSLLAGSHPSTLENIDDFVKIPLPDLEEFHLDTPSPSTGLQEEGESCRQQLTDFGHSLFVGVSPRYLSDFVLHGTTENQEQVEERFSKDLAHAIKYSIIDEPVDCGVGLVANTDTWSVKLLAVSKSLQTSDVIYGTGGSPPSKCIKQMLNSVKSMHAIAMPPEFCLSFVEDCLMSVNEQSIMLANALLERGGLDADLNEMLPAVMESLSIAPSDLSLLLPLAAINCSTPDLSARLNHMHMQRLFGKDFL